MSFLQWGPVEIEQWLTQLQFSHQVITVFTKHNITGETLPFVKDEHLKEMALSIDERIKIKLEINRLLIDNGMSLNDGLSTQQLLDQVERALQRSLDGVVRELRDEMNKAKDDESMTNGKFVKPLPTPDKLSSPPFNLGSPTSQSKRGSTIQTSTLTSTSAATMTPASASALSMSHGHSPVDSNTLRGVDKRRSVRSPTLASNPSMSSLSSHNGHSTAKQPQQPVSEPLKQLRASTDDPCSKVLQAAMKRHHLNDDWRNYALVICYGDKERMLKLDEKPVQIFKELKEKGEHPAIMLRQVDYTLQDTRSTSTPGGML